MGLVGMRATKLLSILFIAGTLTLGLTVSQSVFASDSGGPPGNPHHNPVDDFPPGNPHVVDPVTEETVTGNPHLGNSPPPGYGDPHTDPTVRGGGNPHIGDDKGNPHEFSPRPAHSLDGGNPFEATSNTSHGEGESNTSHGESTFLDFPGEATFNDFPGEAFSTVSFGES